LPLNRPARAISECSFFPTDSSESEWFIRTTRKRRFAQQIFESIEGRLPPAFEVWLFASLLIVWVYKIPPILLVEVLTNLSDHEEEENSSEFFDSRLFFPLHATFFTQYTTRGI